MQVIQNTGKRFVTYYTGKVGHYGKRYTRTEVVSADLVEAFEDKLRERGLEIESVQDAVYVDLR